MKVTNGDIWQAKEPLKELMGAAWPVKTAYWLAKLARKINAHYAVVEQVRIKLIRQYGTTDEKKRTIVEEDGPNWEPFALALNELMEQEEELDAEKVLLPEMEEYVTCDGCGKRLETPHPARIKGELLLHLVPFVEVEA